MNRSKFGNIYAKTINKIHKNIKNTNVGKYGAKETKQTYQS